MDMPQQQATRTNIQHQVAAKQKQIKRNRKKRHKLTLIELLMVVRLIEILEEMIIIFDLRNSNRNNRNNSGRNNLGPYNYTKLNVRNDPGRTGYVAQNPADAYDIAHQNEDDDMNNVNHSYDQQ